MITSILFPPTISYWHNIRLVALKKISIDESVTNDLKAYSSLVKLLSQKQFKNTQSKEFTFDLHDLKHLELLWEFVNTHIVEIFKLIQEKIERYYSPYYISILQSIYY